MRTKLIPYLFIFADFKTLINDDFFSQMKRKEKEKKSANKTGALERGSIASIAVSVAH